MLAPVDWPSGSNLAWCARGARGLRLAVRPCDTIPDRDGKYFGRFFLGVATLGLSEVTNRMPPWFQLRFGVRLVALLLSSLALMAGCAATTTSLNEVMKDPGRYRGKNVSVAGVVTYSGSISGRGLYRIGDGVFAGD